MNESSDRFDDGDTALDALLAHARAYRAPEGLEDAVMEAIRLEEQLPAVCRPWYAHWQTGAAAAALIACALSLALLKHGAEPPALDETLLVEASLASIGDADMIQAVYGLAADNGAALAHDDLSLMSF